MIDYPVFNQLVITQDVFDLPFRMARGQIEESLRTKMASIKVFLNDNLHLQNKIHLLSMVNIFVVSTYFHRDIKIKERMVQLQDAPKGASVTSEATERELELEAQLVEARSIIQEQVLLLIFLY